MITKIELEKPENMAVTEIEKELIMRLHDLELRFNADAPNSEEVRLLAEAQRLIHVGDSYRAEAQIMAIARQQANHSEARSRENGDRIISLLANLNKDSDKMSAALANVEQFELIEAEVVDEFGMSQEQLDRLNQLEFAIQKGIDSITAMGEALREIRDSGLYKRYGTFEDYCAVKWGFSRARAYQFIEAEKTVNNLLTSGVSPEALPTNEAQARALASVPPEKQAEVWDRARAEGKPSAAKIKAMAADHLPDATKMIEIPPNPPCKGGQEDWNPNLWETPEHIAKAIACLLNEDEVQILEPCAGTGMIAKAIVDIRDAIDWEYELTAIEIRKDRAEKLEDNRYFSIDADFLSFDFGTERFDLIATNPPFDIGMEILERSLNLLKFDGRCLFLLPSTYFQTQERARCFMRLNAHIHKVYPIVGRVAYLKNGVPESGRQCEDSIFDIRLGTDCDGAMEFIWQ